jgi:hypothetical protein
MDVTIAHSGLKSENRNISRNKQITYKRKYIIKKAG